MLEYNISYDLKKILRNDMSLRSIFFLQFTKKIIPLTESLKLSYKPVIKSI